MRLQDLVKYPLGDLGFQQSLILFSPPDQIEQSKLPEKLKTEAMSAYTQVTASIPLVVEARLQYFNDHLLLDLRGDNSAYTRLAYSNTVDGLGVRTISISKFDDDSRYLAILKSDAREFKITGGLSFFSQDDTATIRWIVLPEDSTIPSIHLQIERLYFGVTPIEEVDSVLDSRSLSLEDRILSIRAGALLAHSRMFLDASPAAGAATTARPFISAPSIAGPASVDNGGLTDLFGRLTLVQDKPDLFSSTQIDVKTDNELIVDANLTKLPLMPDLDFNRLFTESRTILDANLAIESYNASKSALSGISLTSVADALDVLGRDNNDRDAITFLAGFSSATVNQATTSLAIYRPSQGSAASFKMRYVSPTSFQKSLQKGLGSRDAFDRYESSAYGDTQSIVTAALDRSIPHDHALLVGRVGLAGFGKKSWMEENDEIRTINPFVLAGSIQAKMLIMAAEAAILAKIGKVDVEQNLVEYLPGLRRLQEDMRRANNRLFSSSVSASLDRGHLEGSPISGAVSGFSAVSALYSYGFQNVGSHVDSTDFRLGLRAGQIEGARAIYDALRAGLKEIQLPDLPAGADIDDILRAIEQAAQQINIFVRNLNDLVTQLRGTIATLERELASTAAELRDALGKVGGAADGIRTFSLAGAGFLVGGPIGAGIGAILSLF